MTLSSQRRLTSFAWLSGTILAGIVWRFAPLHLPYFAWKYGGSMLWAAAVYWLLTALMPRARTLTVAIMASLIAIAVELSRLTPQPTIDAFRHTPAGKLLLGSLFSPRNIVAYLVAIALTALADSFTRNVPELLS